MNLFAYYQKLVIQCQVRIKWHGCIMIILYEDTEILVQLSMFNVSVKVVCQVWHLNLKMPNLKNEHRVVQPDKSNESNLYSIIKIR